METMKTIEAWAQEKGHTWQFAATKTFKGWPASFEVSEDDYDSAVLEALSLSFGYSAQDDKS